MIHTHIHPAHRSSQTLVILACSEGRRRVVCQAIPETCRHAAIQALFHARGAAAQPRRAHRRVQSGTACSRNGLYSCWRLAGCRPGSDWLPANALCQAVLRSLNWRGKPLLNFETVINLIGGTHTRSGLKVKAVPDTNRYEIGVATSDDEIDKLRIKRHNSHPTWNYTLLPRNS